MSPNSPFFYAGASFNAPAPPIFGPDMPSLPGPLIGHERLFLLKSFGENSWLGGCPTGDNYRLCKIGSVTSVADIEIRSGRCYGADPQILGVTNLSYSFYFYPIGVGTILALFKMDDEWSSLSTWLSIHYNRPKDVRLGKFRYINDKKSAIVCPVIVMTISAGRCDHH